MAVQLKFNEYRGGHKL